MYRLECAIITYIIGSRALCFSDPIINSRRESCALACGVCVSKTLRLNASETKGDRWSVTIGSL